MYQQSQKTEVKAKTIEESVFVPRTNALSLVAVCSLALLSIPFVAMQLTDEVNWGIGDFAVMGFLLFGTGSLFTLISRKKQRKHRAAIAVILVVALLYLWAELAVGIFTTLGS